MSEGDLPVAVEEARNEVTEAAARSAEVYGLNGSYGRLYATLFFAEEPLSLDELADRSGYAKSTVSTAMQDMERLHVVHRRSVPGEGRRLYFEAETDFWHILQEVLNHEVRREIRTMTTALDAAEDRLEDVDTEQAAADREKIRFLADQYEEWEELIDVLTDVSTEDLEAMFESVRGQA